MILDFFKESVVIRCHSYFKGEYASMSQPDLVSLVSTYDKKLKTLSEEVSTLSKTKEEAAAKVQEKSKYKDLARRLKEERNLYKDAVDDKL